MNAIGWDSPSTYRNLADLHARQVRSRVLRSIARIRSPQRALATTLAVLCLVGYVVVGLTVLSQRTPIEPTQLQSWLSGSMVIYALYHLVRSVWTVNAHGDEHTSIELSDAARLWLAGAPIQRSSILSYELIGSVTQALVKTAMLAVILFHDVRHIELLVLGMFGAIVLLEIVRRIVDHSMALLSDSTLKVCRVLLSLVAFTVVVTTVIGVSESTPSGSPTGTYMLAALQSLGSLASSPLVYVLAVPWHAASSLAVTVDYSAATCIQIAATAAWPPLAMMVLAILDGHWMSQSRMGKVSAQSVSTTNRRWQLLSKIGRWLEIRLPVSYQCVLPIAQRQFQTLREHAVVVLVSLVIPSLLSLSPLLINTGNEQWLFVIGGVTLSTLLLAPPALRLDFRRDVRRFTLLAGFPIQPRTMVIGQLLTPVMLTIAFQTIVMAIAAIIVQPGWSQTLLWFGVLPPFAVTVFAAENAIFLAFPHHERAQGIAMVIRTKVVFLGKAISLLGLLGLLVAWAVVCRRYAPSVILTPTFLLSSTLGSLAVAGLALRVTERVWRRMDCASDAPCE